MGRVRINLHNEDGTPINPDIASKQALLLNIVQLIPQLASRKLKQQQQQQQQQVQQAKPKQEPAGGKRGGRRRR